MGCRRFPFLYLPLSIPIPATMQRASRRTVPPCLRPSCTCHDLRSSSPTILRPLAHLFSHLPRPAFFTSHHSAPRASTLFRRTFLRISSPSLSVAATTHSFPLRHSASPRPSCTCRNPALFP